MLKNTPSIQPPKKLNAPWIYAIGALIFLFAFSRLYFAATDDFRVSNISFKNPEDSYTFQVPPPSAENLIEIKSVLSETFSYIGKGGQAYAFLSEDKKYILKLFKFKHLQPSWFIKLVPSVSFLSTWKESYLEKKKKRMETVFNGYKIAYTYDKENSGLVYIHLSPTDYLKMNLSVKDKLGLKHKFSADNAVFVVQKKGETLRTRLSKELKEGNVLKAKETLHSIFHLYVDEYKKGLIDLDGGVMHNTGFIGQTPFRLDVGKFSQNPSIKDPATFRKDLLFIYRKINLWVERNYPQYAQDIQLYLMKEITESTGTAFSDADLEFLKANPTKK